MASQVFLVQTSGALSSHYVVSFSDRTFADELCNHGYYRNEAWDIKAKDRDFGEVKFDDHVIQYCTGNVEGSPSQIRAVYQVTAVEFIPREEIKKALKSGRIDKDTAARLRNKRHILGLKRVPDLNPGIPISTIRQWVQEGKLSENMNNCGRQGFNICKVEPQDLDAIKDYDGPTTIRSVENEEEVRQYIAARPLRELLGEAYSTYSLYQDEQGRTGELYNTGVIGQIDLLYKSSAGDFLVVETKRTEDTSDKAVGQTARYIGWVEKHLAEGRSVSGLLVVRSASEELKYAVRSLRDCRLAIFEPIFRFELKEV